MARTVPIQGSNEGRPVAVPTGSPLSLQTAPARGSVTLELDAINTTGASIVLTFSVAGSVQDYRVNANNVRGEIITIANGAELLVIAASAGVVVTGSAIYEGPQSN